MDNKNEIELTEEIIESMVYTIRDQKVMLDFDLAKIYGYDTKYLNRQVQRNIEKFPEDFMFQLTNDEIETILRCQNVTTNSNLRSKKTAATSNLRSQFATAKESKNKSEESLWCQNVTLKNNEIESEEFLWSKKLTLNKSGNLRGQHIKYLPYAFTEQGIYMLMTVLKGELATKQSIALIKLFKQMKDYISENHSLINIDSELINNKFSSYDKRFETIENKLDIVMDNFIDPSTYKEFLILNGQKLEADIAYQSIYKLAKKNILIVDDYIDVKTLYLLREAKENIDVIIFSDNTSKNVLTKEFIDDFMNETHINIELYRTDNRCHDRFIFLDYDNDDEKVFLCGSSSKDAGNKITTIARLTSTHLFHNVILTLNSPKIPLNL